MRKRNILTEDERQEKMKTLGGRIYLARIKKGLKQSELGEELECSDQTISNYENDINTDKITLKQVNKLCEVLKIDFDYLNGKTIVDKEGKDIEENDIKKSDRDKKIYSTKELKTVCKYTGLSEDVAKLLHNSQDYSVSLSHILNEYSNDFGTLIYEIKEYLINSVIEQKAKESIKKNQKSPLALFTMPEQEVSSIHLLNCLRILERMSQMASKDKEIVEHLKESSLFADMFGEK